MTKRFSRTAAALVSIGLILPGTAFALRQLDDREFLPATTQQPAKPRGLLSIFGIPTPWDNLVGSSQPAATSAPEPDSGINPDDPWAGRPEPKEIAGSYSPSPYAEPIATPIAIPSAPVSGVTVTQESATPAPAATPAPQTFTATQQTTLNAVCTTDTADVARQMETRLNKGTVDVVRAARFEGIGDQGNVIKDAIDSRRFGTGGPVRDIYQGGGDSFDLTRSLEDYLLGQAPRIRDQVQQQSVSIADNVAKAVTTSLLDPLTIAGNSQGSATVTRTVTSWKEEKTTTLGYDLKRRSGLWNFKSFGHVEFRFISRASVSVEPIVYTATVQACNGQFVQQQQVRSAVTVTPSVTVEYVLSPRDNYRSDTLRGTVTFIDPQQDKIYQVISLASR